MPTTPALHTKALASLSPMQRDLLGRWLPGFTVVKDMSWGLVSTRVLHLRHGGHSYVAKASAPGDHHILREISAHGRVLTPWRDRGFCAGLRYQDEAAHIIVTDYMPGELVLGSGHHYNAELFREAGAALRLLHDQPDLTRVSTSFEADSNRKTLRWLDFAHRIAPDIANAVRQTVASWPDEPSVLVPTHGDWHPRNWLHHNGRLHVIDFGRVDDRPAFTDLVRLEAQEFQGHSELSTAFSHGYGHDLRSEPGFARALLREAVGTAVWAYQVGDEPFEAQGHRMIAEWLVRNSPTGTTA